MDDSTGRVLIVDDEPDMCWTLENILKKKGILCLTALNAKQALNLIESNCVRLVFLDAKLPDIEGLELAKKIYQMDPHIRLVMVSGYFYTDDEAIQKAINEGLISGFISKPFSHDEILKAIDLVK